MNTSSNIKECAPNGFCEVPMKSHNVSIKNNEQNYETLEVIYAYDALCGWCYGFSSDLKKVVDSLSEKVKFTLVNGGIFAGNKSVMMGQINDHIKCNMPNVTQKTGIEFGTEFKKGVLENQNYNYDSKKASIAVMILREIQPKHVFDFAFKIQEAFFYKGLDIQSDDLYKDLIKDYGIDFRDFIMKLNSTEYDQKIELEFREASQIGFAGYPSLAIKSIDGIVILNQGYVEANVLVSKINKIIEENLKNN